MAFVYKAERFNRKETVDYLGPGSYDLRKKLGGGPGYAPFGSTAARYPLTKEEKAKRQKKKGPKPDKEDIRQLEELGGRSDLVGQFDPRRMGMNKPTGVFKSRTKRFRKKKVMQTPGPGQYTAPSFTDKLNKKFQYKQSIDEARQLRDEHLNKIQGMKGKRLVVPSIPSKNRAYGYTVGKDGGFKINKPKNFVNPDDGTAIGPGQYNIPSDFDPQNRKGVMWGRSASANNDPRVRKGKKTSLGPGYYNPISDFKPLYKYKQSAAFASDTPRAFFAKEKRRSLASRRTKVDEDSDEDDSEYLEDATPGPGYYYNPEAQSTFKKQYKDHQFQIFGTASKRFSDSTQPTTKSIGPGHYHKNGGLLKNTFNKRGVNAPFEVSSKRFEKGIIQYNPNPGPGHYENEITLKNKIEKTVAMATDKPFASTSYRFQSDPSQKNLNPGPGAYYNKESDEIELIERPKPSHYFKSRSKRAVFNNKHKLKTPKVGAYNLDYYNIYTPIKKYNEEPKDLRDLKPGFNTGAKRFKPTKELPPIEEQGGDEREQHIKKIFDQLPSYNAYKDDKMRKGYSKARAPFNTKQKRFNRKTRDSVPGPGEYHDNRFPEWNKPTFNLLFIDI